MKLALVGFCRIIPHCHLCSCIPFILEKISGTFSNLASSNLPYKNPVIVSEKEQRKHCSNNLLL